MDPYPPNGPPNGPRHRPESGTTPLPPVTPDPTPGADGMARRLGPVYTLCLTLLILAALIILGIPDMPKTATILALVIGAGSAGILLGHTIRIEIDGHPVHGERVKRVASQQLPHKDNQ